MTVAQLVTSLARNWSFALAIAGRDLKAMNRGSVLGVIWLVIRPLVQTLALVLIVGFVFGGLRGAGGAALDYAMYVLSGLIAWQAMQRSIEDAPSLVRERMEVLRQVVYPIETLPVSAVAAALVSSAVSLLVYLGFALAYNKLALTALLLPVPFVLLVLLLVGLAWLLMVGGVLLRDLREMVAMLMGILVYASPVVLTPEMTGPEIWRYIELNPLAHVVVCFRDVLHGAFHPASWGVFVALAASSFLLGAWVIGRVKVMIYELI